MKYASRLTAFGVLATVTAAALTPMAAMADRQGNKNNWRNLGYLGAAAAAYGLSKHDNTTALIGAAGAAYGASRYEQDRKSQDASARYNRARYYRSRSYYHRTPTHRGRWHRVYRSY